MNNLGAILDQLVWIRNSTTVEINKVELQHKLFHIYWIYKCFSACVKISIQRFRILFSVRELFRSLGIFNFCSVSRTPLEVRYLCFQLISISKSLWPLQVFLTFQFPLLQNKVCCTDFNQKLVGFGDVTDKV
jgi:hypothetical protein